MSTIITDNPYTFTVANNMSINAVFEDLPLIEVIATKSTYIYLKQGSSTTTWNLTAGSNKKYYNDITAWNVQLYRYTSSSSNWDGIEAIYINCPEKGNSNLVEIPPYAYNHCTSLKVFEARGRVAWGSAAYQYSIWSYCTSLESIVVDNSSATKNYSLNGAPELCTLNCTSLKTGYINLKSNSSSNDYLSPTLFDESPNMESITIASPRFMQAKSTNTDVFPNTNDCPIYVPSNLLNTYKTNSYWKKAASRFQAIP